MTVRLHISTPGAELELVRRADIDDAVTKVALGANQLGGAQYVIWRFAHHDFLDNLQALGNCKIDTFHPDLKMELLTDAQDLMNEHPLTPTYEAGSVGACVAAADSATFYVPARIITTRTRGGTPSIEANWTTRHTEPRDDLTVRVRVRNGLLRAWVPMNRALETQHDPPEDTITMPLPCVTFTTT